MWGFIFLFCEVFVAHSVEALEILSLFYTNFVKVTFLLAMHCIEVTFTKFVSKSVRENFHNFHAVKEFILLYSIHVTSFSFLAFLRVIRSNT